MTSPDRRDVALAVAVTLAVAAFAMSWQASSVPWKNYAIAQEKVVAFREIQLGQMQDEVTNFAQGQLQEQVNRVSDAVRLMENLIAAVGDDDKMAEAVEQAQGRIDDWR